MSETRPIDGHMPWCAVFWPGCGECDCKDKETA